MTDVCIICARVSESSTARAIFGNEFQLVRENDELQEALYSYQVGSGKHRRNIEIRFMICSDMGNMAAAQATTEAIYRFQKCHYFFFVGTAGSLNPPMVRLGDVFIPEFVEARFGVKIVARGEKDYEKHKKTNDFVELFADKESTAYITKSRLWGLNKTSQNTLADIDFESIKLNFRRPELPSLPENYPAARPPTIVLDDCAATCDMIVNSESYTQFLRETLEREANIIDMESYGFFDAIRKADRNPCGLVVRGISDYAGRKTAVDRHTSWKAIAVEHAARTVALMIKQMEPQFR